MKILGIIPARGGSKGIPNKNRKLLNGIPLLQYTTTAAKESQLLDEVIFTSEDDILISLAKSQGISVPFKRPAHLATDAAGSLEVVKHAISFYKEKGIYFDAVCLLQVTTPFRTAETIDLAIRKFKKNNCDSLISVQKVPHQFNPHWVFEEKNGNLKIATGETRIIKRRQELPDAFIRDGAIYITKTRTLMEENSFFGNSTTYIETDASSYVNIDTMEDWKKAEMIIKQLSK
ncbi:hypothetical protein ULMS_23100 [Patiriisocius marinistellae]|uniref:Acylneuraminate cytidylyltransferase n=1 Tax=Patiriisocius marinistellae TaxID=2494560 RepID=A0A5J4FZX1_9FLAO|nr:acylneuraminate cytidylyltransferase family protein [Patiriisocius marinistellae]GEQ86802.1 hypothetical protein ULMS_23100 [Patiriisocius marinistellae]